MRDRLKIAVVVVVLATLAMSVPGGTRRTPARVTFTTAGDHSSSTNARAVFAEIGALGRDAHFALGDLSYGATGGEQSWCNTVLDGVGVGFPFELVAGNHESNGQNGNINDFSACLPNQLPGAVGTYGRQYYVDVPQEQPLVRFVMITVDDLIAVEP